MPDIDEIVKTMREAAAIATPGPWHYRPHELGNWGTVRTKPDTDGRAWIVARAKTERFIGEHREDIYRYRDDPDPYEANGLHIAASNPANVLALLDAFEARGRELATIKTALTSGQPQPAARRPTGDW